MERIIDMNVLRRKAVASIVSFSAALLLCSPFQTVGNAADTKLNISECMIKDKTLSYSGNIYEGEINPVTVMARQKDNPSDIRYMRIVTPDEDGKFTGNIKFYDNEITADLFDMEVLFQADEDVTAVTFELTYFNDVKKSDNVNKMKASAKGMLDFMTSDDEGVKIYDNMGVRLDLYNAQELSKDKINAAANKFKASVSPENVVEIANGSIYAILATEAKSANDMINLIGGFDTEAKTLFIKKNSEADTKCYSELSKEERAWIAANVYANIPKDGFNDYEELYMAIRKSIFLRFVNTTHYMELSELILSNTDVLENEMTRLKNETNTRVLDTAMSDVRRQAEKSNFETTDKFIDAVNTALKEAKNDSGNGSGSGGGSGSGAATGGSYGGGSSSGGGMGISFVPNSNSGDVNNGNKINKFTDLAGYDWAADAIDVLTSRGIVSGTASGIFEPGRSITREEFVKMICIAFGFGTSEKELSFTDVRKDDWFAPYVSCAVELGIIYGGSDSEFGTGQNITREDMAVIIYRAAEKKGINASYGGKSFDDEEDISQYAKESVKVLSENGIINGVGDNKFMPKKNAGRAEAAVIIYRCLEKFGI